MGKVNGLWQDKYHRAWEDYETTGDEEALLSDLQALGYTYEDAWEEMQGYKGIVAAEMAELA